MGLNQAAPQKHGKRSISSVSSPKTRPAAAKEGGKCRAMDKREDHGMLTTHATSQALQVPADGLRARGVGDDDAADRAQEGVPLHLSPCTSVSFPT